MSRRCKDFFKSYMKYTGASESPNAFHFWTCVSTIAGALGRKVWIDQLMFFWTPNFYIILVGPAGLSQKSTSIRLGLGDLLKKVDGIHFGPDALTWQALTQEMAGINELVGIGNKQEMAMSCVTLAVSELGTMLDPSNQQMVSVLTDLWDSPKHWKKSTKTQGTDEIENPWINFIAGTTPTWIGSNIKPGDLGTGLISRCVFVYGDVKRHLHAYPRNHVLKGFKEMQADLVHDLREIHKIAGEYRLTKEAEEWGDKWYISHEMVDKHKLSPVLRKSGYAQRKQTHMHKLAIVIAASRRDELVITLDDLQFADTMVSALEGNVPKAFAGMGLGSNTSMLHAEDLIDRVRQAGEIERQALYRDMFNCFRLSAHDFNDMLASVVDAGYIIEKQKPNGKRVIAMVA